MEIEKLKQDKELMQELQKKREQALKNGSIVELYDLLDTFLLLDKDEEVDELYQAILQKAFDRLSSMLTQGERFDLEDEEQRYVARGIYEHALERWDSGDFKGAGELFLILSHMMPASLHEAMMLPLGLTAKKVSLDDFIKEYVEKEGLDEESFFFERLTPKAKEFMAQNRDLIHQELQKAKKWAR
ncbi:MAG: hypothetical protein C6H99_04645 [Epsilonproteobacteria bacterium]|nr:hypothetical protein [Campylobacterota bacterium]NPA63514.1 hypothetical protein [Campylobacterota bacterium]